MGCYFCFVTFNTAKQTNKQLFQMPILICEGFFAALAGLAYKQKAEQGIYKAFGAAFIGEMLYPLLVILQQLLYEWIGWHAAVLMKAQVTKAAAKACTVYTNG